MQCMNIEQDNKFIINGKRLLASWGKKEKKPRRREKKKIKKNFVFFPGRVSNSRPSCFPSFPIQLLRSQGSDYSVILRGLNKGQKKEIYFCNKAKIF